MPAVLVGAALPYHGTHAFVRLVRVCCLGGTPWAWLGESAGAGVPLPRAALVARCASDPAALAAVASLAEGEPGLPAAPGHLAFAAVTVCEALGAAAAPSKSGTGGGLTDATLRAVLPSVLGGLAPGAGPDRRAAALMVAAALAARASLSVDLVQGKGKGWGGGDGWGQRERHLTPPLTKNIFKPEAGKGGHFYPPTAGDGPKFIHV